MKEQHGVAAHLWKNYGRKGGLRNLLPPVNEAFTKSSPETILYSRQEHLDGLGSSYVCTLLMMYVCWHAHHRTKKTTAHYQQFYFGQKNSLTSNVRGVNSAASTTVPIALDYNTKNKLRYCSVPRPSMETHARKMSPHSSLAVSVAPLHLHDQTQLLSKKKL